MSVAAPPTTVHVPAGDVDGEVDELFHTFFSNGARAAMLACDEVGVSAFDLQFRPRAAWADAVRRVAHARPIAKVVDLDAVAHVRFNMAERERQHLFRQLFAARGAMVSKGRVAELWQRREELLATNGVLRERLNEFPLPTTPSDDEAADAAAAAATAPDPNMAGESSGAGTPAAAGGVLGSVDGSSGGGSPRGAKSIGVASSGSRTPAPPPKPVVPTLPSLPPAAPIRRRVTDDTLDREEGYLMQALAQLTAFTHKFVAAERRVRRYLVQKAKRDAEEAAVAEAAEAAAEAERRRRAAPRPPFGGSSAGGARHRPAPPPRRLGSPSTIGADGNRLPELQQSTPRPITRGSGSNGAGSSSLRTAEKEFAALVRTTMARVSQSAIADQRFIGLLEEQAMQDPHEVALRASQLRRLASSPAAHSVSRGASTARRPSTDGLPSDEVARVRRERARAEVERKAAVQREHDEVRLSRAERVRTHAATKQILTSQAGAMRRELNSQTRERAIRAAEAHCIAVAEQREKKRQRAAEVQQQRMAEAQHQRMQHVHIEAMRRKLADAVEQMAVRGQWHVPEDLRGALEAAGQDPLALEGGHPTTPQASTPP